MAIKCEVRDSHSRTNHAPRPKRNVRQLAKARSESVVSCSDGWDEVHTYGSPTGDCKVPFQRARLWIAWINRHWRSSVDALPASRRLAHCRNLVETLTLVLSRCERERRATRDERKDPQRGCTRPPRPACGERIEVRGYNAAFQK